MSFCITTYVQMYCTKSKLFYEYCIEFCIECSRGHSPVILVQKLDV